MSTGFRFDTHVVAYGAALKEHRLWMSFWHSPFALLQLTVISYKEVIHSSEALIFLTAAQGILPDCLALVTSGAYACSLSGLHILYLHTFKNC